MRLNKWIADRGIASRRAADRLIADGRVTVNGRRITELGTKIDPDADRVEVDTSAEAPRRYVALHKPAGYVTAVNPTAQDPKVVTQLLDRPGLFPVGRLDKETTGLLLLTDDGTLVTALNHPEAHKEKEYRVTVDREIPDGALSKLAKGVPLMGKKTRPARVTRKGPDQFHIVLTEGRNRQVRRMCRKVGFSVKALCRVRIDHVRLGRLPEGKWRNLTGQEVARLKQRTTPRDLTPAPKKA